MVDRQRVRFWAKEARKIIDDYEQLYDVAGKRLALISGFLEEHFSSPGNTFRIAVVGNPNLGKTTYSYSCSEILKTYRVPSTYVDLDVYTKSGLAIAEQIDWKERPKQTVVPEEKILKSIKNFEDAGPGIVFGDFPGLPSDKYHIQRLEKAKIALILVDDPTERNKWVELCEQAGVLRWRVLQTKLKEVSLSTIPQMANLNREVIFSPAMLASATSILEEAAKVTKASNYNYERFFSAPELIALQEHLDLFFSIRPEDN